MIALFCIVAGRLSQIQIIDGAKYRKIAQGQYESKVQLPAARGTIYDRSENVIATNATLVSFAADPKLAADDAHAIARRFSQLFGKSKEYYLEKLRSDSRFVWLERRVDVQFLKKVNLQKLTGIVVRYEAKRLYFNDRLAGQLIGCTDIDNKGLAGLELAFDKEMRGVDGYVIFHRDGLGKARPSVDYPRVEPLNGHSITLTIDMGLQSIAEKELKKGIDESQAESGIVVVLQPRTGEILALAQYPQVDPNTFGKFKLEDQKLRAVTDVFEPGSVFKIVTASAALEHGLVPSTKKFYGENGSYTVPVAGGKPRTIVDVHKSGWITFGEAMQYSSNIVMAKVSDLIGSERFYTMARNYGFGIATNVEFPGEVKGVLKKPVDWSGTTLNTIAYGYEIGATPLQIAAAYAAVANNGILMKPYLLKKETDETGLTVREGQPQQIRRVISESTARTLTEFFVGVVERGTGMPARIPGVKIGGKTGTSKKLVEGRYESGNYTASFVGFFPADDPQVVCLVMLDKPRGVNYTGGTISAPVFRTIASQIVNSTDLVALAAFPRNTVIAESDSASRPLKSGRQAHTGKDDRRAVMGNGLIPDVTGYSVRKAVGILMASKFQPVVTGSGIVISQDPHAGQPGKRGMKITLTCQPRPISSLLGK